MSENILDELKPPVPFPRSYWVIPGLLLAGEYPGNIDPDVTEKKIAAMIDLGIRHVVNLMETDETNHTGAPFAHYEEMLVNIGALKGFHVSHIRHQVVDYNIPSPEKMQRILNNIDAAIENGRPVYVHCWGGIGRTGTVIGCFLLRHGLATRATVIDVISRLRSRDPYGRRTSPENEQQVDFVTSWPAHESGTLSRLNRYVGCMLGGAAGDALGAPVEFMNIEAIRNTYGERGITDYYAAYGRIGAITDDTQMTLFTAEGLLRARASENGAGVCNRSLHVYKSCVQWLNTQGIASRSSFDGDCSGFLSRITELHSQRAPGNSCISALTGTDMGSRAKPINNSKGCGGVMRVAPVGLMIDDPEEAFGLGCDVAAITHGHPSGYLAAGMLAAMIAILKQSGSLTAAIDEAARILKTYRDSGECLNAIERAVDLAGKSGASPRTVETLGGGWVAEEALAIGIYCSLCAPDNFERGVLLAVNHGGDSDSTGAIAGNILGCLLGSTAIPEIWKERLELADVTARLAVDLFIRHRDADWWRMTYGNG